MTFPHLPAVFFPNFVLKEEKLCPESHVLKTYSELLKELFDK